MLDLVTLATGGALSFNNPSFMMFGYLAVLVILFYFMLIRPQQKQRKKHREMMESLKADDKIYTAGGIIGVITKVKDNTILVRVADKVEIEVLKSSIGGLKTDLPEAK